MQTLSLRELSHKMWQDGVVIASTLVLHSMNFGAKKKKNPKPELLGRKAASKSMSQKKYE